MKLMTLIVLSLSFTIFAKDGRDLNRKLKYAEYQKLQAQADKESAEKRKALLIKQEQFIKDIETKTKTKKEQIYKSIESKKLREEQTFKDKQANAQLTYEKDKEYALKKRDVKFLINAVERRDNIIKNAQLTRDDYIKRHDQKLKEEIEMLGKQEKLALKQLNASKFTKDEINQMIKAESDKLLEMEIQRAKMLEKK